MDESLEQLLQQCTVKLTVANIDGCGTGFFVAPGLILTCNHVVSGNANQAAVIGTRVQVRWQEHVIFSEAEVVKSFPNPYDLALLKFAPPKRVKLPCVRFNHEVTSRDHLYLFGYPGAGFPNGCPVTVDCEGITGGEAYIKFDQGQIQPGMSGSALLNQDIGMVCGIVKFTRDEYNALGGGAVQTAEILRLFPELKDLQRQFHQNDKQWKTLARQSATRGIHKLPERSENQKLLLLKTSDEVTQRLGRSLHDSVWIDLEMKLQPDRVDCPYNAVIITGPKPSQLLAPRPSLVNVFDRSEIVGKLLILGDAGAGKTTELSKLAETLVDRAEENINNPIPVFFSLASWQSNDSIHDWMVREFVLRGVPKQVSKDLLKAGRVLPLLDGLDELEATKQEACVNAINRFIGNYENQYLVVCCRKEAYENLDTKLQLNGAISLQSLSDQQIEVYLAEVGREELWEKLKESSKLLDLVRTPFLLSISVMAVQEISFEEWERIETQKERLRYLLDAYIIRMSKRAERQPIWFPKKKEYEQNFIEKWIASIDRHNRIEGWLIFIENLLNFLDKKFYKEPRKRNSKHYLIYLAKQLNRESKTELFIEKLQPSWLPGKNAYTIYTLNFFFIFLAFFEFYHLILSSIPSIFTPNTISSFVIRFGFPFLLFIFLGLTENQMSYIVKPMAIPSIFLTIFLYIYWMYRPVMEALLSSRPYEAIFLIFISVVFVIVPICIFISFLSVFYLLILSFSGGDLHTSVETTESFKWSWHIFKDTFALMMIRLNLGLMIVALSIFAIVCISLIAGELFQVSTTSLWKPFFVNFINFFKLLFLLALPFTISISVVMGLGNAFKINSVIQKSVSPNQGIKKSTISFLGFATISSIVMITIISICLKSYVIYSEIEIQSVENALIFLQSQFFESLLYPDILSVSIGSLLGLCIGLRSGGRACIQHFSLRIVLWLAGAIPWNYARFLGYATERRFLQQVGGRYWFIHRFLQEHFAEMPLQKSVRR